MNVWDISTSADEVIDLAKNVAAISTLATQVPLALKQVQTLEPTWEVSEKCPSAGRAVVQFRVSQEVFDIFFNSSVGYRAMFRRGPRIGTFTNAAIIAAVNDQLSRSMSETVTAHVIESGPKWKRRITIARSDFLRSLDPSLAKLWYCTAEVVPHGDIRLMPTGVSDSRIDVGLAHTWAEIRQDPEDCILEAKGAFLGPYGLFQPKDPELRARTLSSKGEA